MSGSMYDLSVTVFSPEGRIFQLEYAQKAVDNSETIVGIKCKDGIILGSEKLLISKLMVPTTNQRIFNVDQSIGCVISGRLPDGKSIMTRARQESMEFKKTYDVDISGKTLAERVGQFVHTYTLYHVYRPFGSSVMFACYDKYNGYKLYMVEPSGLTYAYYACTVGKGKQTSKAEIEKRNFREMTCREALKYVAKMLKLCHEEFKDKKFELELSWVCEESGQQHRLVPKDLKVFQVFQILLFKREAEELAEKEIENDQMAE